MDLETTITFLEARDTGKRDLAQLGSGGLASQVHQVKVQGKCWRCRQEGHHGNDKPEVRKKMCKAFSTKCTKCDEVGHFAKFCRPPRPAGGKPKGEHVKSQNMGVMHHTIDYLQKCKDSKLQPYVAALTADTGAQANILGLNHLNKLGLNIGCLHRSATIMDCTNSSQTEVIGAFLGCIRGNCEITGRTMVHRGMVYVIEGDIITNGTERFGSDIEGIPKDRTV